MRMLLYHQESLLSMLWNAAQDYSNRKRIQKRNELRKTDYKTGTVFVPAAGILTVTTPSTYVAAPTTFSPSCVEIGSMILLSIW